MEVKNPMMDQLLVNTAAQAPASQPPRAGKDAEQPDFDSMVHQKRSAGGKNETKQPKADARETAEKVPVQAAAEAPVTDEQYAIAAAMMFQAQPDIRVAAIQTEAVELAPEAAVEAAPALAAETPELALPEEPAMQEAPEAPEAAEAFVPAPQETAETPRETPRLAPEAPRAEAAPEARPEAAAEDTARLRPEAERAASPEARPEAARTERAVEAPRFVRSDERAETENDAERSDMAPIAPETALFERVEAPVVKVAEVARPIPLEAENGVEQLGTEIGDILVNSVETDRIVVTLTPENLGRLTVELSRGTDGALNVVLHTTTQRAADLLERNAGGLQNLLSANVRGDVDVTVRGSEETQQQFLNPDGQSGQNARQQQRRQNGNRQEQRSAEDFLQQLRLGLVDVDAPR